MGKNISAVIPVKANSSRLYHKNILPFSNSNLLVHKIRQLKACGKIDEIIVSSDSEEMLQMALKENVFAIKRPKMYADESQPFGNFLEYLTGEIRFDHLLYACCTSPLVETDLYEKAIDLYFDKLNEGYDSLISVYKYQHFLLDDNGPINFSRGLNHVNSQNLPAYYNFTCGIVISPKEHIKQWKYHFGPNVYKMEVSQEEAIDIDTYWDYLAAQAFYQAKHGSENMPNQQPLSSVMPHTPSPPR
ncbi:MAG TPA: acylneuraminate cytidylyltransferase [Lachnospiraceae bacterium]|nr:acylneuraminate cytidylyltransferase [Lachnospiraceae bacterium]